MPMLKLKGNPVGHIKGVLFDKDGTLSNSEEYLKKLSKRRIKAAIYLLKKNKKYTNGISRLEALLSSAYGLTNQEINPGGTIAVGSRLQNIFSTATVLCILGEDWPDALEISRQIFELADNNLEKLDLSITSRKILPGAKKFLQELRESGVKCGIISNDNDYNIQNRYSFVFLLNNLHF